MSPPFLLFLPDRQIKLEFHGSTLASDAGLLAYRELDDSLGLTNTATTGLHDTRTGQNTQHSLPALFRQSIYGDRPATRAVRPARFLLGLLLPGAHAIGHTFVEVGRAHDGLHASEAHALPDVVAHTGDGEGDALALQFLDEVQQCVGGAYVDEVH